MTESGKSPILFFTVHNSVLANQNKENIFLKNIKTRKLHWSEICRLKCNQDVVTNYSIKTLGS